MSGKLLLGVAGVALLAAGGADAADVSPVVVPPVVLAVPAVTTGPTISVTLEKAANALFFLGQGGYGWLTGFAGVDVKTRSGWGFTLVADDRFGFSLPIEGGVNLGARVYRSIGDLEIGAHATAALGIPGGLEGFTFGGNLFLERPRLTIENWTDFIFPGNSFNRLASATEFTFNPTERLEIVTDVNASFFFPGFSLLIDGDATLTLAEHLEVVAGGGIYLDGMGADLFGRAGVRLPFGPITPFATLFIDEGLAGEVGVELEQQLGASNYTIFGNAVLGFEGGGQTLELQLGLRYQIGDDIRSPINPLLLAP